MYVSCNQTTLRGEARTLCEWSGGGGINYITEMDGKTQTV